MSTPPRDFIPRHLSPRLLRTLAALTVIAGLAYLFFHWQNTRTRTGADAKPDNKTAARAGDLSLQLDEIKASLANQGRDLKSLPQSELEQLLATRRGQTVAQLRADLAEARKSHDPYTRAAALLISGQPDEALTALAALGDATALRHHRLRAQAFEAKFRRREALAERQAVVSLLDKEKDPLAWADAQSWVAASSAVRDARAAEAILREVVSLRQRVQGPEHPATLASRNDLANALYAQKKNAEGEAEQRAVLAVYQRVLGPEHPDTLQSRSNLAISLIAMNKNAEAETEHRSVLAVRQRVLGPEHPHTLASRHNLALALEAQDKNAEAEAEHRVVLAVRERVLGPEHPDTLESRYWLASALILQDKWLEARTEAEAAAAGFRRVLGSGHRWTQRAEELVALLKDKPGSGEEDGAGGK